MIKCIVPVSGGKDSQYGVEIKTITGGSVEEKVLKYSRFPDGGARHCTDELKIRETKYFLKNWGKKMVGFRFGTE